MGKGTHCDKAVVGLSAAPARRMATAKPTTTTTDEEPSEPVRRHLVPGRPFYSHAKTYALADLLSADAAKELGVENMQSKAPPRFRKPTSCPFSKYPFSVLDYKNTKLLQRFVSDSGRMLPRRMTGVSAKKQRELATAIKRARFIGLMGYTSDAVAEAVVSVRPASS